MNVEPMEFLRVLIVFAIFVWACVSLEERVNRERKPEPVREYIPGFIWGVRWWSTERRWVKQHARKREE